MLINLENIFRNEGEVLPLNFEYDFSDVEVSGVHPVTAPVKVTGEIRNRTGVVTLNAKAEYTYCAPCDRCAVDVKRDYSVTLSSLVVYELNDSDNDEFILAENMQLDFEELMRNEVILSFPSKLLCKEDCKGLCAVCGKNLNEGSCSCEKPTDPRLEVLKQLLDK